jgi:plastocyanin
VDVGAGKVTLTVTNKDDTQHTFTLDDGSSNTSLPPGETQTIVVDLASTVGWHCSIHPSMTGTLNVG